MNAWETVWYRVSNFKLKYIGFVVCNTTVPMFLFRKISLPWDGFQDQSEDSMNPGISGFQVSYKCN